MYSRVYIHVCSRSEWYIFTSGHDVHQCGCFNNNSPVAVVVVSRSTAAPTTCQSRLQQRAALRIPLVCLPPWYACLCNQRKNNDEIMRALLYMILLPFSFEKLLSFLLVSVDVAVSPEAKTLPPVGVLLMV